MRTFLFFALIGTFTRITAAVVFTIPDGTTDGIYEVYTDKAGVQKQNLIGNHTDIAPMPTGGRRGRRHCECDCANGHVHGRQGQEKIPESVEPDIGPLTWLILKGRKHSSGHTLDKTDWEGTQNDLAHQCRDGLQVRWDRHLYAVKGNVAAFVCNFDKWYDVVFEGKDLYEVFCHSQDVNLASRLIQKEFGPYRSGWVQFRTWAHASIGFDKVDAGKTFCGRDHY